MRILGVDPGSLITGYGLILMEGSRPQHISHGNIRTPAKTVMAERLLVVFQRLSQVILEHKPQVLAVERVFVAKNAASALKLGHARGVVLLAAAQYQLPVFEYTALQVKSAVVGYGKADKAQVQKMTQILLNLPSQAQQDAADALAVAICHGHSRHLENKIERFISPLSG